MSLSPHLDRWIFASASKLIKSRSGSTITFFEGTDKDDNPREGVEFRLDGPRTTKLGSAADGWEVWVAINLLVSITMDHPSGDPSQRDFHRKYKVTGVIRDALDTVIPVYKYGDNVGIDDGSFVGCLKPIHDKFNRIQVNHFGQVEKSLRLEQATVECHYVMHLSEAI
jgi:hypothetical protein